jgi:hypothetical protein
MDENLKAFRTFNSIEEAEPVMDILTNAGIACKPVNPTDTLASSMAMQRNAFEVQILINIEDFDKAEQALLAEAKKNALIIDKDHYLSSFTDDELMEILEKPDEWSEADYIAAQALLKSHGKSITEEDIKRMNAARLEELRKPVAAENIWIALGYLFAVVGGLGGLIMGYLFMTTKKLLPNGERVYAYDEYTRKSGRNIFIFGVAAFAVTLISFLIRTYSSLAQD